MITDNGLVWTICFLLLAVFQKCVDSISTYMSKLEDKQQLPGEHSVGVNHLVWQTHDWGKLGEEWSGTSEWKQSLIDQVMLKYIESGKTILEIGPGAGKWSEVLQGIAKKLILVDLSENCISICKKRFENFNNIEYFVNDGSSLDFISHRSVDYVWSFDVFVHISPMDIDSYLAEISRVMTEGGQAVIHHAKDGGGHGGWRSRMSSTLFCELLEKHGLTLIAQFDTWGDENLHGVRLYHDTITVFRN